MRETGTMGIDPELLALLDDLRAGYGNAEDEAAAKTAAERRRDWALRSGYTPADEDQQPSPSGSSASDS
jgi:hypothetical protein